MVNTVSKEELGAIAPSERVLLLPHCLRPIETCPGKYSKQGLVCPVDCSEPCAIRVMQAAAIELGYKGVCIAPGGSMVLRFVENMAPRGIVAVACAKELGLGMHGVEVLVQNKQIDMPAIAVVPLAREGCVDTEVDMGEVMALLSV